MKISPRANKSIQGMDKQASDMEKTMMRWMREHGYEIVRYVSNRVLEREGNKLRLEKEIRRKEKELSDLRAKTR